MAFKSALAADSVNRSASSITTTRHPPIEGAHATRASNSLTSSILIDKPSVRMISTSGCPPLAADKHALHVPQPRLGHTSACANATAALERPLPGGPVKTHACVISCVSSPFFADKTAPCNLAIMCSCPTSVSKTLMAFSMLDALSLSSSVFLSCASALVIHQLEK